MSDIAIKVERVSKQYRLGQVGRKSLSQDVNRWWHTMRGKEDPYLKIGEDNDRSKKGGSDYVWALRDIDFDVKQGEVLGIIGRNGAGKSTLLKLLSKVTAPTTGAIKIKGRIASLLEVGTGFHPDLSGRDNIFLNGAILGMTKKEIAAKFDQIVDFAGVERYIDTPVKRYSSGMYVRLAFAVAAHLEPEILIVDEVLAVGDAEFQKKCLGKMKDVSVNDGRTVLFVSHNINSMLELCDNGLLMQNGRLVYTGTITETVNKYVGNHKAATSSVYINTVEKNMPVYFNSIRIVNNNGDTVSSFLYTDTINIDFELAINNPVYKYDLFVLILDSRKRRVFACETPITGSKIRLSIEGSFLVRGDYSIHTFINVPKIENFDMQEDICSFTVFDNGSLLSKHGNFDYGQVFGKYSWISI